MFFWHFCAVSPTYFASSNSNVESIYMCFTTRFYSAKYSGVLSYLSVVIITELKGTTIAHNWMKRCIWKKQNMTVHT